MLSLMPRGYYEFVLILVNLLMIYTMNYAFYIKQNSGILCMTLRRLCISPRLCDSPHTGLMASVLLRAGVFVHKSVVINNLVYLSTSLH